VADASVFQSSQEDAWLPLTHTFRCHSTYDTVHRTQYTVHSTYPSNTPLTPPPLSPSHIHTYTHTHIHTYTHTHIHTFTFSNPSSVTGIRLLATPNTAPLGSFCYDYGSVSIDSVTINRSTVCTDTCSSVSPDPIANPQPTVQPTALPTVQPSSQPSGQPSSQPSGQPSAQPSSQPTLTHVPTAGPTQYGDEELPISSSCVEWVLGYSGDSCDLTCSRVSRECDVWHLLAITTRQAFDDMVDLTHYMHDQFTTLTTQELCVEQVNTISFAAAPGIFSYYMYNKALYSGQGFQEKRYCTYPSSAATTTHATTISTSTTEITVTHPAKITTGNTHIYI
jgi:hypothetical protein